MFIQTSFNSLEERLKRAIAALEAAEPGLRVVSARIFTVPVFQVSVAVTCTTARRVNILEEFILRSAAELDPGLTVEALASLLGLDPLFVKTTAGQLARRGAVVVDDESHLKLTATGQELYVRKLVPEPPEVKDLGFAYDALTGDISVKNSRTATTTASGPRLPGSEAARSQRALTQIRSTTFTVDQVIAATTAAGLGLHVPAAGKLITGVNVAKVEAGADRECGVLVVQDTLLSGVDDDNVTVWVYDVAGNRVDARMTEIVAGWLTSGRVTLAQILAPTANEPQALPDTEPPPPSAAADRPANPGPAWVARQAYVSRLATARASGTVPPDLTLASTTAKKSTAHVELMREAQVRTRFLGILKQAKHRVLILLPWLSEAVVDGDVLQVLTQLASCTVQTIIGWGVAGQPAGEAQPAPDAVVDALHQITTPEGVPAVTVWWVGNQPGKDVIVDQAILLSGAHNWLSYRGKRWPHGESVYAVTLPETIQEATCSAVQRLEDRVKEVWIRRCADTVLNLAELKRCCVTWIGLQRYDQPFEQILSLGSARGATGVARLQLLSATLAALAQAPLDHLSLPALLDNLVLIYSDFTEVEDGGSPSGQDVRDTLPPLQRLLRRYAESNEPAVAAMLTGAQGQWERIGLWPKGASLDDILGRAKPTSQAKINKHPKKR
jgi:hypothetical protein